MRLSKIKLAGFKSFVDPTTIPLPSNLVGVVGPNGCGKSNIIDAVRWVLGESSAKHLRGDSMADVIFNGSTSRKPVGQATIELIFDNIDGSVGGQYAQYNEISVKRTVHRDGQSNYFLNGTKCRRRDITDLFLGTGLGPRSYSIIEQGMISRVIEAKPEELRIYLEEAAGISKYKERRRETETRIRHTRENLDRLNDLREELDKQLAHLQRQAKTAERYKELKEQERLLKGQLGALRWRALDGECAAQQGLIGEGEIAQEAMIAKQRNIEARIEKLREEHTESNDKFNEVQGRYYAQGAEIARIEQAIQHAKDRRAQLQGDLAEAERAYQDLLGHIEADKFKIEELTLGSEENQLQHEELRLAQEMSAEALTLAEQQMHDWQTGWEQFNQRAAEPSQVAQVERARMQQLEQHMLQAKQRTQRLEEEQRGLSTDELDAEIARYAEDLAIGEEKTARMHDELQSRQQNIHQQREQLRDLSTQLDAARSRVQSLRGRQSSLEALQQAALGKRQGAVSQWLEGQGLSNAQRLAQGIKVKDGWERAVECVLGFHLEAVCVAGLDPVAGVLQSLEHGSLTVFDTTSQVAAPAINAYPRMLEKLDSPWRLDALVAGVYLADDLGQALAMRGALAAHESVITREGIWLGNGWLRVVRDADEKAGVLHREQELKEIAAEIDELMFKVEELQNTLDETREAVRKSEEQREEMQREVNLANRQLAEVRSHLSARQARLDQRRSRTERIAHERQELEQQLTRDQEQFDTANERLSMALAQMDDLSRMREGLIGQRDQLRDALLQARDKARTDRDRAHEIALRLQSMHSALETTRQTLGRMQEQLSQQAQRREGLKAGLAQGDDIDAMNLDLRDKLDRRIEVERELTEVRRTVEGIEHDLREGTTQRNQAELAVQDHRTQMEQLRMNFQGMKVRLQTLVEKVQETGWELKQLLEDMPEQAAIQEWEKQAEQVGERIQRLGPVNLMAISEFEEQSKRKEYLDAQHADLMEALETLESAIHKIDRETRTRFKETFDKVNTGLQTNFPKLFGGGHAYLELTGEDLLDTGVTVMARPPGKRNSSIHLLSGGEKALTAVALVFSIFELNPAPFCMLDEVDAPLDEANVGRFCTMVKEMAQRVQFIFITHNKSTMEMASQLNGVTMHEPGVSRLVAVDVDEAYEMAVG